MTIWRKSYLFFLFYIISTSAIAQVPQWALSIGSAANDDARSCVVAPNGNVYLTGLFSGTADLDPSPAVHNVTSNGLTDIFLACYTSGGSFLWAISMGGLGYDGALSVAADKDNNAIIAGFFSGQNINFDPLGSGKSLSDKGIVGPVITQGGDGFVAKYSPTGICTWALDLGDSSVFDLAEAVTTDATGNVYVGGDFHYVMDIDPSPASNLLNAATGTAYLIKYNPAGQLVWGFNFGGGGNNGVDNAVWDIRYDGSDCVYLAGCYQGTSNFSLVPVAGSTLSCVGVYDGYVAKYDTNGNYKFVVTMAGTADDQAKSIAFDTIGNIYVTGYTSSPAVTFKPSMNTVATPGHGGNQDIFLAKYTSQGVYQWGKLIGSQGDETGICLAVEKNNFYCSGYFHDTVDFDPSPAVANLISNGKSDIYLCKYDLDGNYICGFNAGSAANDVGRGLAVDAAGYLYSCGQFNGINTNFSPVSPPVYLTTQGAGDAYLVKYDWTSIPGAPGGYLIGDTICAGDVAILRFIAVGGMAPYTIVYTNGINLDTVYGLHNNQVFIPSPAPVSSTSYKLVLIKSAGNCNPPGYPDTTALVKVKPLPVITVTDDTTVCPGTAVRLHVRGASSYHWIGSGIDSPGSADQYVVVNNSTVYKVFATNMGCTDTGLVQINVFPALFTAQSPQNQVCVGDTAQLFATGGDIYTWYPDASLSSDTIAAPRAWPRQNTTYTVVVTESKCWRRDTLPVQLTVRNLPDVKIVEAYDVDCGHKAGLIAASGAVNYQWYPSTGLSNTTIAKVTASPQESTIYYVKGTDQYSCANIDSVQINVFNFGTGRLYAPTGFTPNNDGKNDCFSIHIPGLVSAYEMKIYNRWGQCVFTSFTYGQCWDGNFQGVPQDLGTYFYSYKCYTSNCGALEGKADVQLIR